MKYIIHYPVQDFGFVEAEFDQEDGRNVADVYREVAAQFKTGVGLPDKEMNLFIDTMLLGKNGNHIDTYNRMSKEQQYAVQSLKRGLKRIKTKGDLEESYGDITTHEGQQ